MKKILTFLMLLCVSQMAFAGQNVVIVLDNSDSMNNQFANSTRMEIAKQALIQTVKTLPDDTTLGIVLLNGLWEPDAWEVKLQPLNKAQVVSKIESYVAHDGTPLGGCMKAGSDALLELRKKQRYGTYRLLIVTDGEANDQDLVDQYLPDILSRGLMVDVIGVDIPSNHSLATQVSNYRKADDPDQLFKAISQTFAETTAKDSVEDFSLISTIPDEMAPKFLDALTEEGNHPIGQKVVVDETGNVQMVPVVSPAVVKVSHIVRYVVIFLICGFLIIVIAGFMLANS